MLMGEERCQDCERRYQERLLIETEEFNEKCTQVQQIIDKCDLWPQEWKEMDKPLFNIAQWVMGDVNKKSVTKSIASFKDYWENP